MSNEENPLQEEEFHHIDPNVDSEYFSSAEELSRSLELSIHQKKKIATDIHGILSEPTLYDYYLDIRLGDKDQNFSHIDDLVGGLGESFDEQNQLLFIKLLCNQKDSFDRLKKQLVYILYVPSIPDVWKDWFEDWLYAVIGLFLYKIKSLDLSHIGGEEIMKKVVESGCSQESFEYITERAESYGIQKQEGSEEYTYIGNYYDLSYCYEIHYVLVRIQSLPWKQNQRESIENILKAYPNPLLREMVTESLEELTDQGITDTQKTAVVATAASLWLIFNEKSNLQLIGDAMIRKTARIIRDGDDSSQIVHELLLFLGSIERGDPSYDSLVATLQCMQSIYDDKKKQRLLRLKTPYFVADYTNRGGYLIRSINSLTESNQSDLLQCGSFESLNNLSEEERYLSKIDFNKKMIKSREQELSGENLSESSFYTNPNIHKTLLTRMGVRRTYLEDKTIHLTDNALNEIESFFISVQSSLRRGNDFFSSIALSVPQSIPLAGYFPDHLRRYAGMRKIIIEPIYIFSLDLQEMVKKSQESSFQQSALQQKGIEMKEHIHSLAKAMPDIKGSVTDYYMDELFGVIVHSYTQLIEHTLCEDINKNKKQQFKQNKGVGSLQECSPSYQRIYRKRANLFIMELVNLDIPVFLHYIKALRIDDMSGLWTLCDEGGAIEQVKSCDLFEYTMKKKKERVLCELIEAYIFEYTQSSEQDSLIPDIWFVSDFSDFKLRILKKYFTVKGGFLYIKSKNDLQNRTDKSDPEIIIKRLIDIGGFSIIHYLLKNETLSESQLLEWLDRRYPKIGKNRLINGKGLGGCHFIVNIFEGGKVQQTIFQYALCRGPISRVAIIFDYFYGDKPIPRKELYEEIVTADGIRSLGKSILHILAESYNRGDIKSQLILLRGGDGWLFHRINGDHIKEMLAHTDPQSGNTGLQVVLEYGHIRLLERYMSKYELSFRGNQQQEQVMNRIACSPHISLDGYKRLYQHYKKTLSLNKRFFIHKNDGRLDNKPLPPGNYIEFEGSDTSNDSRKFLLYSVEEKKYYILYGKLIQSEQDGHTIRKWNRKDPQPFGCSSYPDEKVIGEIKNQQVYEIGVLGRIDPFREEPFPALHHANEHILSLIASCDPKKVTYILDQGTYKFSGNMINKMNTTIQTLQLSTSSEKKKENFQLIKEIIDTYLTESE